MDDRYTAVTLDERVTVVTLDARMTAVEMDDRYTVVTGIARTGVDPEARFTVIPEICEMA